MATITDHLITQLQILGVRELRVGLRDASTSFSEMAETQGVARAATVSLAGALQGLDSPLALVGIAAAGITAEIRFLKEALDQFAASERALAPLAIALRDVGSDFPIDQAVAFAQQLEHLTGISHRTVEALIQTAATFGLNRAQIEKLVPTIEDIAVGSGLNPEQVFRRLRRASRTGRVEGLQALGINPQELKGDLTDINNLIEQVGKRFPGQAEAFAGTLPGLIDHLGASVNSFLEAVGRLESPLVVGVLKIFITNLENFTALLTFIEDRLSFLFPTAAALGQGKANPLALKGDPEQTGYMAEIAKNTAVLSPFIDHVLGGTGEVAAGAFSWRDMRAAFSV